MLSLLIPYVIGSPIIATPYAQRGAHEIRAISPQSASVPQFERAEIDLDVSATFDNPFDPDDIAIDATVTTPSNRSYTVPAFFDRSFTREIRDEQERLIPVGVPRWRLRIAPMELGLHRVEVKLHDRNGDATPRVFTIQSTKPSAHGMVRIASTDHRYFQFDDGTSYYPIGENVAWGGKMGLADYERWFPALGKSGANYGRVWLSPSWTTFALEQPGKPSDGKGLGQFDLGNAWRLDRALELARDQNLYLTLCLDSYNILRPTTGNPWWDETPHNAARGGPLHAPSDFWTDEQMDRFYRMKLRYLVARYGAMRNLFAWELWNEVDQTHGFRIAPVQDWHERIGKYLHQLDPYGHLITTSTSNTMGVKDLELIPQLDVVQTHHYGSVDLGQMVATQQSRKSAWGKPHFFGEIGADAMGAQASVDTLGFQIHDPIWASVATGASGGAMTWWWDSLVEKNDLYPLFGAVTRFIQGVDFPSESFQQIQPQIAFARAGVRPRRDLTLVGRNTPFTPGPLNSPRSVTVRNGAFVGTPVVSETLHGTVNHASLHNPILFRLSLPRACRFEVQVTRVSGIGGATLRLDLDGNRLMTRPFADTDGLSSTDDIWQYAGVYGITVPAGTHTVRVENVGDDWMVASYRIVGARSPSIRPPLDSWAIVGDTRVLGWVRVQDRTWTRVILLKQPPAGVAETVMRVNGLASGSWKAEMWDTWKGVVSRTLLIRVGLDGVARVPLPPISDDLGIKLIREGTQ